MSAPIFTRTPPGLSNQAAFLGVDIVVFIESGRRTLSLAEIEQGLDNGDTADSNFWRAVLESFSPQDKTFHIKTIGSKTSVKAIAEMITTGLITKVVAAMDRDLDHYRGTATAHTNVIYTRGYSWESDVWTPQISSAVFRLVVSDRKQRQQADAQIDEFFQALERCFHTAVRVDRSLASTGADPLPREAIKDIVRPSPPGLPILLRDDLAAIIARVRTQSPGLKRHPDCKDILLDLHGHTLAKAVLNLLQKLLQDASHRLNKTTLTSMALAEFVRNPQSPALAHYSVPIRNIVW